MAGPLQPPMSRRFSSVFRSMGVADRRKRPPRLRALGSTPARGGELVASIRSEPSTYNRYVTAGASAATDVVTFLTQARLVRVNRATDELEPWLAEGWTSSPDGLTYTITLRPDIQFSDGAAVDVGRRAVLVSRRLRSRASRARSARPSGPRQAARRDRAGRAHGRRPVSRAVRARPAPPRQPADRPEAQARARRSTPGSSRRAGCRRSPVTDVVGLGPFQLVEHVAGQRLVFARNPHYFRRDAAGVQLPYLDRLTLAIVPDQNTEALRLEAAESDLMSNGDIRPQDYAAFRRLADEGGCA